MEKISIDFQIPTAWKELSDKQLRYVFGLIADDFDIDTVKTLCLLRWTGTKVLGRLDCAADYDRTSSPNSYLLKKGKYIFEMTPLTIAELLPNLDWLGEMPSSPVRPNKMNRREALPSDFNEVPFETYIIVDNLYQGYLQTQNDELLDEIAAVVYPGIKTPLSAANRVTIFYWVVSLKDFFAKKFPDFLQSAEQPAADGNLLGSSSSVEDAMNAQIRALTKGDITKEAEILAMDTWRALTELNAQAREYKELNSKINSSK